MFRKLLLKTFNCKVAIKRDKRDNTYYIYTPSVVARILINGFSEKTTKNVIVPELLDHEIPHYIRGVFDGDGTVYLYRNKKTFIPTIRITTGHEPYSVELKRLLRRLGIYSRINKETGKNSEWYNVVIRKQKDFLMFYEQIGSDYLRKKKRLEDISQIIKSRSLLPPV